MKLRLQLILAFGFLFAVIIFLGGVGSYYVLRLSEEGKGILKDNYESLHYVQNIEKNLSKLYLDTSHTDAKSFTETWSHIDSLYQLQAANVTEQGEGALTQSLGRSLQELKIEEYELAHLRAALSSLSEIYALNRNAILERNLQATATSEQIFLYMIIFGVSGIVVGLIITLSVPGIIFKSISHFNEAIKGIASGDYETKVEIESNNEFSTLADSFNRMSDRLNEYDKLNYTQLLREKNRLNAVINQFSDPVLGLDRDKNIIFINNRALKILGMKRSDFENRSAEELEKENRLLQKMLELLDRESKKSNQPLRITEGNKEKLFSLQLLEIELEASTTEERNAGYLIILNDITAFAEKDRAKTRFIATLSHELKTPVAAIEMGSDLLSHPKSGALNEEQQKWLDSIRKNNHRIRHTINELLDLTKIESGSIEVINEKEKLDEIIQEALDSVKLFLDDKEVSIKLEKPEQETMVLADRQKLVWVLNNLLTNAVRYTPRKSTIKVCTKLHGKYVEVSVLDQGPGIPPEDQLQLFEPYKRSAGDKTQGTGLGLAISKEFIEAMGGSISVVSPKGQGAELKVKLLNRVGDH